MRAHAFPAAATLFGLAALLPAQAPDAAGASMLDLLDRVIPVAEAELQRDGSDPTDVPALARRLGTPAAALQFVREQIGFEPYAGVLRGPAGALAARAANSCDRALLLQALLQAMGRGCRIVAAPLDDAQANVLVDAFLQAPAAAGPAADAGKALADAARRTGLAPAALQQLAAAQQAQADAALAEVQQLATAHAAVLRQALQGRAADAAAMRAAAVQAVRQHAFVQLAERVDGKLQFRDLDASPLGGADGQSRAGNAAPVDVLPQHTARFQLQYVTSAATTTILDVTTAVADALRAPLGLAIAPAEADLPGIAQAAEMQPAALAARLRAIKLWQASLRTGSTEHPSRVFDLAGGLHDVGGDGRVRAAGKLGDAIGNAFGGLGGGDEAAKATFVSLKLTATLRAPDGQQRAFDRVLFDAAAHGRGELPALQSEILLLGGPLGAATVTRTAAAAQLLAARALRDVLRGDEAAAVAAADRLDRAATSLPPLTLLSLQLLRERSCRLLAEQAGARCWQPLPQLLLFERRAQLCTDGEGCASLRFDWMANDVRFLAGDGGKAQAAFDAALAQGAFDTVLEAVALERQLPAANPTSAAHVLEQARIAGRSLQARAVGDGRLGFAVGDGTAWYEIDPTFGCAVGRLPGGYGGALVVFVPQSAVEYSKTLRVIASTIFCWAKWWNSKGKASPGTWVLKYFACAAGMFLGVGSIGASPLTGEILGWLSVAVSGGSGLFLG